MTHAGSSAFTLMELVSNCAGTVATWQAAYVACARNTELRGRPSTCLRGSGATCMTCPQVDAPRGGRLLLRPAQPIPPRSMTCVYRRGEAEADGRSRTGFGVEDTVEFGLPVGARPTGRSPRYGRLCKSRSRWPRFSHLDRLGPERIRRRTALRYSPADKNVDKNMDVVDSHFGKRVEEMADVSITVNDARGSTNDGEESGSMDDVESLISRRVMMTAMIALAPITAGDTSARAAEVAVPSTSGRPPVNNSPASILPIDSSSLSRGGDEALAMEERPRSENISTDEGPSKTLMQRSSSSSSSSTVDLTITSRVYMDFGLCPTATRQDRTLGNRSILCEDADEVALGRVVIGLYGKQAPQSVANFVSMCDGSAGSSYAGTIIHKIVPGEFIQGGKQGVKDKGEVEPPTTLGPNSESVASSAFKLKHTRPGTVSLCLSVNDDVEAQKARRGYQNVEFLITTGPGPAPELDNGNIVIGMVLEGMDVISKISTVPTYKPSERIRQLNDLAKFFGDERAVSARSIWQKPLKAVVVRNVGVVNVSKPALPPMLP